MITNFKKTVNEIKIRDWLGLIKLNHGNIASIEEHGVFLCESVVVKIFPWASERKKRIKLHHREMLIDRRQITTKTK